MINKMPIRETFANNAILSSDLVNQIVELHKNGDLELAKEVAFAALIYVISNAEQEVSDDRIAKIILHSNKAFIERNARKYRARKNNQY